MGPQLALMWGHSPQPSPAGGCSTTAFYRSALYSLLRRINAYLVRWLREKFRRLRPFNKAKACWQRIIRQDPSAFAHWAWVLWF
jgi:hypothetical protein